MVRRIAAICALTVFAVCLLMGLQVDNPFTTTVIRALKAMVATFIIGLVVGYMAQRMLDENMKVTETKMKNNEVKSRTSDR